jgi:glycine/sarcosine N-methyltransferase
MKLNPSQILSTETFYDVTSEFYEQMIDFEKNLLLRTNVYKNIFKITGSVADLGCGVGLDSVALAINQHTVTAFDVSPKMVAATKLNAQKYGLKITAEVSSISAVPKKFNGKFNYIVCVGNTIAHLNLKELKKTIARAYDMLLPGGKIFLHILNYGLIKRENRRINNITVGNDKTIIRFYDFHTKDISFNILSFSNTNSKDQQLISTKHYPHTRKHIVTLLKDLGFTACKTSSNFSGEKFNPRKSKDLFVEAWK